jgi:hypothetical protein
VTGEFWKEHERQLQEAQAARRSRRQRIRERDLEIIRIEAAGAVILHAIDGLSHLAKPIVESMFSQPRKELQKRTGQE